MDQTNDRTKENRTIYNHHEKLINRTTESNQTLLEEDTKVVMVRWS